jgi:hypothetical protein
MSVCSEFRVVMSVTISAKKRCFVFRLKLVYSMLPVSLDCLFVFRLKLVYPVLPVSLDCLFIFRLKLVYPMLPVSLDCLCFVFRLACVPYVASFSGLFFALSLCSLCCQFLWILFLVFRLKPVLCCQFLWIVFVLFFALSLCTLCCQFLWIVCFVFRLKLVYPMLPISLDCFFGML